MAIPLIDHVPTLIFPEEKRYPFDSLAIAIVRSLYKRNWQVPGIKVEFKTYGTGMEKWTFVSKITGYGPVRNHADASGTPPITAKFKGEAELFTLRFDRPRKVQNGQQIRYGDISEMIFREEILKVYADSSTPIYYLYVGPGSPYYPPDLDALAKDLGQSYSPSLDIAMPSPQVLDEESAREQFMHTRLIMMKRLHKPRLALIYDDQTDENIPSKEASITNNTSMGHDYAALPTEPQEIKLARLYKHFAKRLKHICDYIKVTPAVMTIDQNAYYRPKPKISISEVSHPLDYAPIYTVIGQTDYDRIAKVKCDGVQCIPPSQRYAVAANGPRLIPFAVPGAPAVAYDNFTWCGSLIAPYQEILCNKKFGNGKVLDIPFRYSEISHSRWGIITVHLKYANDCYVVDNDEYLRAREEMYHKIAPRDYLTSNELDEIELAHARTIVPLTSYDGSYKKPFLLVHRELDFDEVELVGLLAPRFP